MLEERERHAETLHARATDEAAAGGGGGSGGGGVVVAAPLEAAALSRLSDRFVLDKSLACYTLSLELSTPIDYVLLQVCVCVLSSRRCESGRFERLLLQQNF